MVNISQYIFKISKIIYLYVIKYVKKWHEKHLSFLNIYEMIDKYQIS